MLFNHNNVLDSRKLMCGSYSSATQTAQDDGTCAKGSLILGRINDHVIQSFKSLLRSLEATAVELLASGLASGVAKEKAISDGTPERASASIHIGVSQGQGSAQAFILTACRSRGVCM